MSDYNGRDERYVAGVDYDDGDEAVLGEDPYPTSPDRGDNSACNCGGAWHEAQDHCVSWPCPGCDSICPPEPGVPVSEDEPDIEAWGKAP